MNRFSFREQESNGEAQAPVRAAVREKSRLAHAVRCLHHTSKYTAASVRHADAIMDQMMVTQLMKCGKSGEWRVASGARGEGPVPS